MKSFTLLIEDPERIEKLVKSLKKIQREFPEIEFQAALHLLMGLTYLNMRDYWMEFSSICAEYAGVLEKEIVKIKNIRDSFLN